MLPILLIVAAVVAPAPAVKPATNTKCPVMGDKVDPRKSPKVVVKGQEYYICCSGCKGTLEKDPGKYLNKDGTPKNAK